MKAIMLILSFITVWLTACDDSVASSYDPSVESTYSSSSVPEHGRFLTMSSSSMSLYFGMSSQRVSRPGSMVLVGKVCDSLITKEDFLHDYVPTMALSIMEDICGVHHDTLKCNSVDNQLDKLHGAINEDMKDTIASYLKYTLFMYFTDKSSGQLYYLFNWPCGY